MIFGQTGNDQQNLIQRETERSAKQLKLYKLAFDEIGPRLYN